MSTNKIVKDLIKEQELIFHNPESSESEKKEAINMIIKLINVQGDFVEKTYLDKYEAIKITMNALGFISNMAFMTLWMYKGFKFEEEGVLSSFTFKKLIGDFKKK